jgi:hypothetical protein
MARRTNKTGRGKGRSGNNPNASELPLSPADVRNVDDPGDATARNFRYQYAYGVMLLVAAKCGDRPYVAVWCEHHEDFLAERDDSRFDGYQIKTSRPELGAWTLRDTELVRSIGRFADLVGVFAERIAHLFFVSNTECDTVTPASNDDLRRGRCPKLFLQHIHSCPTAAAIKEPFRTTFSDLQAECGCGADALFSVLYRMDIIHGPSRNDCDAVLAHEHLPRVDGCQALTPGQLDGFRDDLIAIVHRASSLQVTDPIRHIRALVDGGDPDPVLIAKRLSVTEIVYRAPSAPPASFQFPGAPALALGAPREGVVLEEKLRHGELAEEIEYMRERERAAEYHLIEDATRRPDQYPRLLRQVEQMVLGECVEAHLRARQPSPYGPTMMIDVQERLKRLAHERPEMIGHHPYECLIGVAGLLTSDCRVWWSPRFTIPAGSA